MLNISGIHEGFVLDHIKEGESLAIYHHLQLDKLDCTVAIIKNAKSIAEIFAFNIIVTESDHFVQVDLETSDCPFFGTCKNEFLNLLYQADDFSIHVKADKVLFSLTYNTHDHYYKGKKRT